MTIVSTAPTQDKAATADYLVLFVPNRRSLPNLIVSSIDHAEFYDFINYYFYGEGQRKPFTDVGLLHEELGDIQFEKSSDYGSDDEYACFEEPQQWFQEVIDNYGTDAIIVCSDYC